MEFDHVGVFLYSDEEGTSGANLPRKIRREVMEERRTELLAIQEGISLRKSQSRIGSTIEVLVEGPSEETDLLLESRHEGQAPDIDGVVYLNDGTFLTPPLHPPSPGPPGQALSPLAQARSVDARSRPSGVQMDARLPVPGDFVKAEITDASTFDLVGRIVG